MPTFGGKHTEIKMKNSGFEDRDDWAGAEMPFRLTAVYANTGSTCNLYKARVYGKWILIKELKERYRNDVRFVEAFKKEQELGVTLNHPNLPRYEILAQLTSEKNWVVMEFIEGYTLPDFIKAHPYYFKDEVNVKKFVEETASAIRYLHSRQILHLDIKPDNILITNIGNNVKLIDLGFCHTDVFQGTEGLTKGFESPERNLGIRNEAEDYYGLGKLLEFLRINNPAFPSKKFKATERGLLSVNPVERKNAFLKIEKRPKEGRRSRIWFGVIFSLILLCIGFMAYRLSFEHDEVAATQDSRKLEQPNNSEIISNEEPVLREGRSTPDNKQIKKEQNEIAATDVQIRPADDKSPSSRKSNLSELEDLKKEVQANLRIIFQPLGARIRESVRKGNYGEAEYKELDRQVRKAIHQAMQTEEYEEKYSGLSSGVIADVVASEMQASENALWQDDWNIYEKEFRLRQSRAK